MKNLRIFTLGLALGLAAAISTVGLAQNSTSKDQQTKSESCCAMDSCCCKGDSCSMKKHSKEHSSNEGCCCCSGDSCNTKMKDKQKQG